MPTETLTSQATETIDHEMIDHIVEQSGKVAIEKAAQSGARVEEVQELQIESVRNIVGAKEGDEGVAGEIVDEAKADIEAAHRKRMSAISDAKDATVMKDNGNVAGVQHDGSKKIEIAARMFERPEALEDVAEHEAEHRRQEDGNQMAEIPETGNELVDAVGLRRIDLREHGAMKAEGGVKASHPKEYHDYTKRSEALGKFVEKGGHDGEVLVAEAGRTVAGFQKLHRAIIETALEEKLEKHALAA